MSLHAILFGILTWTRPGTRCGPAAGASGNRPIFLAAGHHAVREQQVDARPLVRRVEQLECLVAIDCRQDWIAGALQHLARDTRHVLIFFHQQDLRAKLSFSGSCAAAFSERHRPG